MNSLYFITLKALKDQRFALIDSIRDYDNDLKVLTCKRFEYRNIANTLLIRQCLTERRKSRNRVEAVENLINYYQNKI